MAVSLLQAALDEPELADELRAQLHMHHAVNSVALGAWDDGAQHAAEAIELARRSGDLKTLAEALCASAAAVGMSGADSEVVRSLLDEGAAIERAGVHAWPDWSPTLGLIYNMASRGEFADARAELVRLELATRERMDPSLSNLLHTSTLLDLAVGEWDAVEPRLAEGREVAIESGRDAHEVPHLAVAATLAAYRGDVQARELARDVVGRGEQTGQPFCTYAARAAIALLDLAEDRPDRALVELEPALRGPDCPRVGLQIARVLAAEALAALGRANEGEEVLAPWADWGPQRAAWSALFYRTRALLREGDDALDALVLFERALENHAGTPHPFEVARTQLARGLLLRRQSQKREARESIGEALATFERLGARRWAERAETELAHVGGRPTSPGKLTATEQQIAELVAGGRSNQEVARALHVSPKTVEWNLSKVYRKLHLRSRTELTATLARQSQGTPT